MRTLHQLSEEDFSDFLSTLSINKKRKAIAQRKFEKCAVEAGYRFDDEYVYENAQKRLKIICPVGHVYFALGRSFVTRGVRCSSCSGNNKSKSKDEFESLVTSIGYKFGSDYSYVNARTPVHLICLKGKDYFVQPDSFKNAGSRCTCCSYNEARDRVKAEIKAILSDRGFSIVGKDGYISAISKLRISCQHGHEFDVLPTSIRSESFQCKTCRWEAFRDSFTKLVIERGYKLSEHCQYVNETTEVTLLCPNLSEYTVTPSTFKNLKFGCPCCDGQDKEIAKNLFEKDVLDRDYKFSDTYQYINARIKVDLVCPNGCDYSVSPYSFRGAGVGCPCLAASGFDTSKSGYLYLQEIYSGDELLAYKFGITNRKPKERMDECSKKSKFRHELNEFGIYHENGHVIHKVESAIKKELKCRYLDKSFFKDGWTETIDPKNVDELKQIVERELSML